MVHLHEIEEQLVQLGCNFRFWGRAEIKELSQVLLPNEKIAQIVNGQWEGGMALLCATDQRLLLVDKKPMYLTLEDIRYDMVSQVDYSRRLLNATIFISTPNKTLRFTTTGQHRLRTILNYTQQRVMEIREHYMVQQFQDQPQRERLPAPKPFMRRELLPSWTASTANSLGSRAISFTQFPPVVGNYMRHPFTIRHGRHRSFSR